MSQEFMMLPRLLPLTPSLAALLLLQYALALPSISKTPSSGIQFKDEMEFKVASAETALTMIFRQTYLENLIIQGKSARSNIKKLYRDHDLPPVISGMAHLHIAHSNRSKTIFTNSVFFHPLSPFSVIHLHICSQYVCHNLMRHLRFG